MAARKAGESVAQARTVAANVFVMGELFYLFNCRSMTDSPLRMGVGAFFANAWLWGGVALMVALQLLFTYAPLMNRLFATAPIGLADWGRVVAVGLAVFAVIEGEKALRRRGGKAI